jgi:hypothetical protein
MGPEAREMTLPRAVSSRDRLRAVAHIGSHLGVIALSAGIALSLPWIVRVIAANLLAYWSFVENEKAFLVSIEVIVALGVILLAHYAWQAWRSRRRAEVAASAGMMLCIRPGGTRTRRRIRHLKERHGFGRDVMVMGSTGFNTFVDPAGDLHEILKRCRSARIMLLDPHGEGAQARARSLLLPEVTSQRFEAQIRASIDFLRELRAGHRDIRLKLYDGAPILKLAVLGEHIWLKHYHPGVSAESLPEYMFEDLRDPGGFYAAFYHYFLSCWEAPASPELDLETGQLVYRDATGREVRRDPFPGPPSLAVERQLAHSE